MVGTCKSNANAHSGLAVASNQKKIKAQINADEAHNKVNTTANREAILTREHEILAHIGATEDFIQQEDDMLQACVKRPDLCPSSQSLKWKCPETHLIARTRQLCPRKEPLKMMPVTDKCNAPAVIEVWKMTQ